MTIGPCVGALKATGNRGLQPAMDHILEHDGQPVPDLSQATSAGAGSTGEPIEVDDDEDDEELRAALKISKGEGASADAPQPEAAARASGCYDGLHIRYLRLVGRASSVRNAERCSGMQMRRTSTLLRAVMISLRNPPRRYPLLTFRVHHHSNFLGRAQKKPLTEEEKKQKLAELRDKMAAKRAARAVDDAAEAKANEAIRRKAGKVLYCRIFPDDKASHQVLPL